MKIRCIIIDDEQIAREGLQGYASKIDFLEVVGICRTALEANKLLQYEKIDLMFLDIQMPEMTGIEYLQTLTNRPLVVLTTAYRDYAAQGFDMEVADYIVKPVTFQRFLKACNKALRLLTDISHSQTASALEIAEVDHFFVKSGSEYIKIMFSEILYIEGLKDYVAIHTTNKKYLSLISLKSVELKLPSKDFIRTHRSFIIATKKIDSIEGSIVKVSGVPIPISREMQEQVYSRVVENKLWKRKE